jgi:hypothetical protein
MRKLQTSRAATTDAAGSTINNGDYVTIVDAMAAARGHRKDKGGVCARGGGVSHVGSGKVAVVVNFQDLGRCDLVQCVAVAVRKPLADARPLGTSASCWYCSKYVSAFNRNMWNPGFQQVQ